MAVDMKKLQNDIIDGLAPIIKALLREVLSSVLEEFIKKDPMNAKLLLVSTYPAIDVKLQPLTEKTDTQLDNAAVSGVMEAFEKVAKDNNFSLPNLDDD